MDTEISRVSTTFWQDFTIAEAFGIEAVQDTFNRAFAEWKTDYKYLTELVIVLNHKIYFWYDKESEAKTYRFASLYDRLWRQADEFALDNLKDEELSFYFEVTD